MRRRGRTAERHAAYAAPRLTAIGEDPGIRRIAHRVEQRYTDMTVVGVIPAGAAPALAVVDRQDHLRTMTADRRGEIATQRHIGNHKAVRVVEEFKRLDTHDIAAS